MDETIRDGRTAVYEIGYLIAGMPDERVSAEADLVKGVITGSGATILTEEAPRREHLAYTMRKKTVSGSYDSYDTAHFGWVKFEAASDKIEAVKKAIEVVPSVLRMLLITTVRENTYLGKRAPAMVAGGRAAPSTLEGNWRVGVAPESAAGATSATGASSDAAPAKKEAVPAAPAATIEEMDKSIDEMVKEA